MTTTSGYLLKLAQVANLTDFKIFSRIEYAEDVSQNHFYSG